MEKIDDLVDRKEQLENMEALILRAFDNFTKATIELLGRATWRAHWHPGRQRIERAGPTLSHSSSLNTFISEFRQLANHGNVDLYFQNNLGIHIWEQRHKDQEFAKHIPLLINCEDSLEQLYEALIHTLPVFYSNNHDFLNEKEVYRNDWVNAVIQVSALPIVNTEQMIIDITKIAGEYLRAEKMFVLNQKNQVYKTPKKENIVAKARRYGPCNRPSNIFVEDFVQEQDIQNPSKPESLVEIAMKLNPIYEKCVDRGEQAISNYFLNNKLSQMTII